MAINWKKLATKIPHRIQVGPKTWYEICYVDSFVDPKVLGESRFDIKQIVIKRGQSPKELVHTLWHEFLHCLSWEYNVTLTETQVLNLEKSLYYIIKPGNLFIEEKTSAKSKRSRKRTSS